MKVDNYQVDNQALAELIDKICEADGSPSNKIGYLADAARMLAFAIEEIVRDQCEADD